ncbi:MAG TPA: cytochrome c oxidase assembly protein [Gaiellaceae bacterium]|nr:cytochrome c oxidase assembly protein [Gaiellaceae bacterium]
MDPYAWPPDWHVFVVTPLLVGAYAYGARRYPPSRPRVVAFAFSQVLLLAVFLTPIETIALRYLLSVHLLQNVVVAEWAPGLAVLGLAPSLARRLERFTVVRVLTHPLVALPLWLGTYYVWHVPPVYDAALRHQDSLIHLEHVSYFLAGALMWWPVIHGRISDGIKAAYMFAAFVLVSPLGLLLALLPRPVYSFYVHAPRLWGLGHLADQQIAGLTMVAEEAIVFFAVFAYYMTRFFRSEAIAGVYGVSGSRR